MDDLEYYPPSVRTLVAEFAKLPGVGRRSAERMAFHVLAGSRDDALRLALAVRDVKTNLRACARCFNVAEGELCAVCADPRRDTTRICVVELPRDIIAIEKTGVYRGVYHVLQGRLAPADGVGPEKLRVAELARRVRGAAEAGTPVAEIVLATHPSVEGDATARYLAEALRGLGPRVTRLARGLASGTDLESAAISSIVFAFEGRREEE